MDTRQAQINTFTDGLNTDLHPLTTPNTVLTDCINGTIITYNGNEYILQNDMGNYQLEHAVLSPNYIPIGIKEYAGIIYIVSYNPIEKKTEIGSYPSPKTIFDSDGEGEKEAKWIVLTDEYNEYTALSKKQAIQLYSTEDKFMLNPGDKYYLYLQQDENKIYQTIEFYILSKEKNLFPLDRNIVAPEPYIKDNDGSLIAQAPDRADYKSVNWEIPGWLAYKFRIATLDQFNLYLTNIKQPGFILDDNKDDNEAVNTVDLEYSVMAQAITSDFLFDNQDLVNKLKVWIAVGYIDTDGSKHYIQNKSNSLIEEDDFGTKFSYGQVCTIHDIKYASINKFLFTDDISPANEGYEKLNIAIEANSDKTYFIEAVPMLENVDSTTVGGKGSGQSILYDNFKTTLTIDLDKIKNANDSITVFDTYKYLVSTDGVTLNFTIDTKATTISDLRSELWIYKIVPRSIEEGGNTKEVYDLKLAWAQTLNEINYLGQNIISCNFNHLEDLDRAEDVQAELLTDFEKEQIYLLELKIYTDGDKKSKHTSWYKTLITSELMNPFYNEVQDFSTIYLNQWMSQLKNYVQLPDVWIKDTGLSQGGLTLYRGEQNNYQLTIETDGQMWQDDYPVEMSNSEELETSQMPSVGVIGKHILMVQNFNADIFNKEGIWNGVTYKWSFDVKTNKNTLSFNDANNDKEIELYKKYRIELMKQPRTEKNWDRVYMYDYCQCSSKGSRNKKIKFLGPYYYWGYQFYDKDNGRVNRLYRAEITNVNDNPPTLKGYPTPLWSYTNGWDKGGAGSENGFYDLWTTDDNNRKILSPYMFMRLATSVRTACYWRMERYADKIPELDCIRVSMKINSNMAWCVIPMDGGEEGLKMDYLGEWSGENLRDRLLKLANQFSIHLFAYVPSKASTYYLLVPLNVRTEEKLSETLTTGTYTWKFDDLIWGSKSITDNTISKDNLLLNGSKLIIDIDFNNLKCKLDNSGINVEKSKFKNINLTISDDLTDEFTFTDFSDRGNKSTNDAAIKSDITDFLHNLITKSMDRQQKTDTLNLIREYSVGHDLNELNITELGISDKVIKSYDSFVKHWKGELTEDGKMRFYSTYTDNIGRLYAREVHDNGEQGRSDNGYYLLPGSDFKLPIYEEKLWDNVTDAFKTNK